MQFPKFGVKWDEHISDSILTLALKGLFFAKRKFIMMLVVGSLSTIFIPLFSPLTIMEEEKAPGALLLS